MTEQTLLAAVHAAANPNLIPAADAASQPKEISMAETAKPAGDTAVNKPTTIAELSAAFPDLVSAIRAESVISERDRLAGIDKVVGKRKGEAIEKMVADMKADVTCTPEKAAMRIVQYDNDKLDAVHANIKGVEAEGSKVNAAPNSGGAGGQQQFAATPEGWKAEWEASEKLQAEFPTSGSYVGFMRAETGNVVTSFRRMRG